MAHYVCSWCDISFEELPVLHLHMGVHIDIISPEGNIPTGVLEKNVSKDVKDSDDDGEYQCKVCHKHFSDPGMYLYHMQAHSEGKTYQCKICGWIFCIKSSLYNHICNHINEKPCRCTGGHHASQGKGNQPKIFESAEDLLKCSVCDRGYCTKKNLYKHIQKHVGHLSCSICTRAYENKAEYDRHMEHHDYLMFFRCEICFESFYDREKRDDHMRIHTSSHSGGMVLTENSTTLKDRKFMNRRGNSEMIVSKKLKREDLQESGKDAVTVITVSAAPKTVGPLVSKDLNPTEKSSGLRSILKDIGVSCRRLSAVSEGHKGPSASEHRVSATSENMVNATSENKVNTAYRQIVCTNEIPSMDLKTCKSRKVYSVTVEDDVLSLKSSAGAESGKYKCTLCVSVLGDKLAFWQHLSEHSEEVPYTCKICLKIFSDVNSRMHHSEQKCSCALCGRLMHRKYYSVHANFCPVGRPFRCRVCIKRFSSSDVFRDHMESHSREKSCRCRVCGEVLLFKYEADRHKMMHRKDNIDPYSTILLSEDEDDSFSVTPSAKNPLCISDEEKDVEIPVSSVKLENDIDSSSLELLTVVKEEPFSEDRKVFNDTAFRAEEQSNVIMVTEAVDMELKECAEDPLA
ncbi:zinc finger protein 84-like [Macrobrachium rosenbergii]|uniref:zinc finger protein 84-like n=1 Tax=Macrobrachium rosenbergii TaxID=79674 RepID=UPI0034D45A42